MAFTASDWGQQAEYEINSGQVPSSQSSVPILITMDTASFPSSMLDAGSTSALNGGGDIRASTDTAGATQLAIEIISCVTSATPANQELVMWVLAPTVDDLEVIYITWNKSGESQPAVGAAFGRNAVWTDYIAVYHLYDYSDSTGGADLQLFNGNPAPPQLAGGKGYDFDGLSQLLYSQPAALATTSLPFTMQVEGDVTRIAGGTSNYQFALSIGAQSGSGGYDISIGNYNSASPFNNIRVVYPATNYVSLTPSNADVVVVGDPYRANLSWDSSDNIIASGINSQDMSLSLNTPLINNGNDYDTIGIGGRIDTSETFAHTAVKSARILRESRTQDFFDTEENNQSDQAAWATFGTPYSPGGSTGIEVTPATVNVDYTAPSADINTPQVVSVSSVNFDYNALSASITLAGAIDVTASGVNVFYQEQNPIVSVSAEIVVVPSTTSTAYNAPSVSVSISTTIEVNATSSNVQYDTYQAYVVNEDVTIECACAYNGIILDYISLNGIISGDISGIGIIDDTNIGLVGAIDGSDIGLESELCHCD